MSPPSSFSTGSGLGAVSAQAADAAAALSALKAPAQSAADTIDQAFSRAGASLAKSLGRAASDGKISLQELARPRLPPSMPLPRPAAPDRAAAAWARY